MASGRYAKITINSNHDGMITGMTSLHICDASGVKWNDETMTHTAGGGALINGEPKNCSNTNTSDYWQIQPTFPSWWKVDLGEVRTIGQIKTRGVVGYDASRAIKDFTLSLSDNDVDWTTVYTGVAAKNTDEQTFYLITAITPDPLSVSAVLSGTLGVTLPSSELSAATDLDVSKIDYGYFLSPDPLESTAGLSASLSHALPSTELQTTTGITATLTPIMPAPFLEVSAALDVSDINYGFFLIPDPFAASAAMSASMAHILPSSSFGVTSSMSAKTHIGIPATMSVTADLSVPGIVFIATSDYIITYLCYLTPQEGSIYDAIALPISSFQGRFKSGDPSYLSCVIPGSDYATAISDRNDPVNPPELSVYMRKTFSDGNVITEQIMAVDLEDTTIDEGSTSYSITLSGHRTTTYSAKAITLTGASYKNLTGGKTRYRCAPDLYLRPGDTVTVNGDTFTADNISIAISVDSQTMEVSEE